LRCCPAATELHVPRKTSREGSRGRGGVQRSSVGRETMSRGKTLGYEFSVPGRRKKQYTRKLHAPMNAKQAKKKKKKNKITAQPGGRARKKMSLQKGLEVRVSSRPGKKSKTLQLGKRRATGPQAPPRVQREKHPERLIHGTRGHAYVNSSIQGSRPYPS